MTEGTDHTGYTDDELTRLKTMREFQRQECAEHLQKIRTGLLEAVYVLAQVERAQLPFPAGAFGQELDAVLGALNAAGTLLGVAEHGDGIFEGPSDREMLARLREMDEMGLTGRGKS